MEKPGKGLAIPRRTWTSCGVRIGESLPEEGRDQ